MRALGAAVAGSGGMRAGGGSGAGEGAALRQQPPLLLPRGTHVLHRRPAAQVPRYVLILHFVSREQTHCSRDRLIANVYQTTFYSTLPRK